MQKRKTHHVHASVSGDCNHSVERSQIYTHDTHVVGSNDMRGEDFLQSKGKI